MIRCVFDFLRDSLHGFWSITAHVRKSESRCSNFQSLTSTQCKIHKSLIYFNMLLYPQLFYFTKWQYENNCFYFILAQAFVAKKVTYLVLKQSKFNSRNFSADINAVSFSALFVPLLTASVTSSARCIHSLLDDTCEIERVLPPFAIYRQPVVIVMRVGGGSHSLKNISSITLRTCCMTSLNGLRAMDREGHTKNS